MTQEESARRRSIVACTVSVMAMSLTLGLCWPLLGLLLEQQGVPQWLNGLSASAQMLAILAVMPVAPALIGRFGVVRAIALGSSLMAVGLALLPVFDNVWAWFPIRFLLGMGAELVFITGDVWINQLAVERTRGRLIGLYGTFMSAGMAAGPMAIIALGTDDWTVLYLGLVVVVAGIASLAIARGSGPVSEEKPRARLFHFMRVARMLMFAGLMFGLVGSSVESLLPVYGLNKGLDQDLATLLVTVFIVGSLFAQLPSGWLADHVDGRKLLTGGAAMSLLMLAALPASVDHEWALWIVMLVMGACMGSFYIVAMTIMGRRYRGADLIGINTSFGFVWGIGAAIGPGISGSAMSFFGPDGMPGVGVVLCAVFVLVCLRGQPAPVRMMTDSESGSA